MRCGHKLPLSQIVYVRQGFRASLPRLQDDGIQWARLAHLGGTKANFGGVQERSNYGAPDVFVLPLRDAMLNAPEVCIRLSRLLSSLVAVNYGALMSQSYGKGTTGMGLAVISALSVRTLLK